VGLVAPYARWKGQPLFIEAAARARAQTRVPLRFYIVGGPQYRTSGSQYTALELEGLVRQSGLEGTVGLVPFQAEPAPIYHALDVLVHASTEPEPFGRSIAEAMAAGCAVIAATAGGAEELFRHDVSGIGFPPGDVEALANAIVRLSEDPALRRRLSERARSEANSRFTLDRLGDELLGVYDRLLARG
jgi:glycosyltransferase involved in cell wall biosynthesis